MGSTNSILINRFFSRNTLREIIEDGESPIYSTVVRRYISEISGKTKEKCISEIYNHLKKNYQNEYFYKNTILNKLLINKHNISTTTALTEIPIATSKADLILINGKAIVYEIKTPLDNFERLKGQLSDYYKAFTRVCVVTSENNFEPLQMLLGDSPVGIYLITKRGSLKTKKLPKECTKFLSKTTMFKILRKNEYEQIILEKFGKTPSVSQFKYYQCCQEMFESLSLMTAYNSFIKILKYRTRIEIYEYEKVPYELKFLAYFSNLKKNDYIKLFSSLNTGG